ncbi:MAG: CvpA family protein [Ignavibacteriales bacterium]|nr:MAG: CvpA family protein [Ignavibacteriales bacterium]
MNFIDILIALACLIGFILGFKDGFIRKLIGLVGFAIAVVFALNFSGSLGKIIESAFNIELYLAEIIAGAAIFLATILIFSVVKRIVHPFDKVNNLLNQLIGGSIGVIQVLFFASAVFLLLNVFNFPDPKTNKDSMFYSSVYSLIPVTIDFLGGYTPQTKKLIKDYINDKDSTK